ncbi:hypothetical protein [Sphingobacterium faecium]|jgi:ABC-type Fe3+-hydroxamate transport system substrate-binding protein|uniref:hypothetical protein n=1 Tax=Sphingobacterium faecium TaxID=34087 RepID=UPI003209CB3E
MQSNQEILVEAILNQYEVDQAHLPQGILDEIYAIPSNLVTSNDIINYTKYIGELLNKPEKTADLVEILDDEVHIIIHKLKFITAADRPKVIVVDGLNPTVINTSQYVQECLTISGGISTTRIDEADKVIIINDEELTIAQIPNLLSDSNWYDSNAIKLNQVFLVNKEEFGKTPGKNYCLELETLAEILQPKYFFYGLEGKTWIQFQLQ